MNGHPNKIIYGDNEVDYRTGLIMDDVAFDEHDQMIRDIEHGEAFVKSHEEKRKQRQKEYDDNDKPYPDFWPDPEDYRGSDYWDRFDDEGNTL